MKGYFAICAFLAVGYLAFLTGDIDAYVFIYRLDTSSGFCDTKEYGKIPLGQTSYAEDRCERLTCRPGELDGAGCGSIMMPEDDPTCRLVRGSGNYPDCCPGMICDR